MAFVGSCSNSAAPDEQTRYIQVKIILLGGAAEQHWWNVIYVNKPSPDCCDQASDSDETS